MNRFSFSIRLLDVLYQLSDNMLSDRTYFLWMCHLILLMKKVSAMYVETGDGCQRNLFTNFLQTLRTKICLRLKILND